MTLVGLNNSLKLTVPYIEYDSMAAPDVKVQFRLSTGTLTVPHMIAAGGDVQLLVSDEHWLNQVSGGLPDTALAVGGHEFSLRELDVAKF